MIKPVDVLLQPDERFKHIVGGIDASGAVRMMQIEDRHDLMLPLELGPGVPDAIRLQFDIARHAYIYAWFVYELVTLAESHCYGVLENALRLKAEQEGRKARRGLKYLSDDAINWGWLNPADFEMVSPMGGTFSALDFARKVRNNLAHGKVHLLPSGSYRMMKWCGEVITKLFPEPPKY